jgi:3-oxoacyl-[acyl-carrier protein] reductase
MGFAAEGCTVHIASRSKESLEAAREKIRARHNVPVEIHPADFSKGDTARGVVEAVGHADILVNNAGAIPRGDIFGMTEPKWREAWDLKVFGYMNATRAMLEKMYARKEGRGGERDRPGRRELQLRLRRRHDGQCRSSWLSPAP